MGVLVMDSDPYSPDLYCTTPVTTPVQTRPLFTDVIYRPVTVSACLL